MLNVCDCVCIFVSMYVCVCGLFRFVWKSDDMRVFVLLYVCVRVDIMNGTFMCISLCLRVHV